MLIEATPRDIDSLAALLPEGGDPADHPVRRSVALIGSTVAAPEGVIVTYDGMIEYRGADIPPVMQFLLAIAAGFPRPSLRSGFSGDFAGRLIG